MVRQWRGRRVGREDLYMQVGRWIYHFTTIDCPGKGREGKAHEKGKGGKVHTRFGLDGCRDQGDLSCI